MQDHIRREVADAIVPSCWIVGPRSMMVDRSVPRLEFLWMPKAVQPGGTIGLTRARNGVAPERKSGWRGVAHRIVRNDYGATEIRGPIIDLRLNSPANWAHAQIFHLPLAAMAREWLGETPTVLLTAGIPKHIITLFELFGFEVLATERAVAGDIVTPHLSATGALAPARHTLVVPLIEQLDRRRAAGDFPTDLPAKVFVARRDTRKIENEAEIEAELAADGFVKVYPETLSVIEQIELFNNATQIVAIHGAALAPLLFRSPNAPPFQLIEILPAAHVANCYQLIAGQLGGQYVGVRGRTKPHYVRRAYQFDGLFADYSLEDFSVDIESLRAARAVLLNGAPPEIVL